MIAVDTREAALRLAKENGADVTLGLLYKEGKDGQGAPADAMLQLFRNGFEAADMDDKPLNMSSSTAAWFKNPEDVGNEDGHLPGVRYR